MDKRAIYSGFNDERRFIVNYLKERHGWEPVFFSSAERSRKWVEKDYPDAIFRDGMALRQACFDYSRIGTPVPVDAKIIGTLSKYELSCLNLLEDTTGWNFSFAERRRYYYDILKYWNTVIHRLKPDLYVHWTRPHSITDYTLCLLCKYYYSIPTIYIEATPHFDAYYNAVGISVEDSCILFHENYHSKEQHELNPDVKKYLNQLRSKDGKQSKHILKRYDRSRKEEGFQFSEFIRLIISTLLCGKGFRKIPVAFKKNKKPFDSPDSKMNSFNYFWFKERLRRKNKHLGKIYAQFCNQADFKKRYIYFAVPYQPEATTCPSAGVYEDMLLVLDILSASIPEDWTIYYKEHPATFFGGGRGSLRRDCHFYEKVASYYNVKMIPVDTDTFKLIDNSEAVVSVAGTVSWEAAVRGKPSLFFGNVWYQGCKSLFRINTYQDCVDAIEKIRKGYKPDQNDIERYVASIQEVSVKGMIHCGFYERIKKCPDPKHEMERIAKTLYESYERHYAVIKEKSIC